jgi:hypothetical protein
VRLAHHPRRRVACLERGRPVTLIPYIEQLAEYWGELCGSSALASEWADRLITITRLALSSDTSTRSYFHGTSACLSALFTAGRYEELIELVKNDVLMVLQTVGCQGDDGTRATG